MMQIDDFNAGLAGHWQCIATVIELSQQLVITTENVSLLMIVLSFAKVLELRQSHLVVQSVASLLPCHLE